MEYISFQSSELEIASLTKDLEYINQSELKKFLAVIVKAYINLVHLRFIRRASI